MPNRESGGFVLDWQNLIMTTGLLLVMAGGFWTLAYTPIQNTISDIKQQLSDLRETDLRNLTAIDNRFLTQREYIEFKTNSQRTIDRLSADIVDFRKDLDARRAESATRQDVQNALNTTRVEFLSEVRRLDQAGIDNMKRREFDAWKSERDKTISSMQDRQQRFSEALDAMYSKLMQQMPSYAPR